MLLPIRTATLALLALAEGATAHGATASPSSHQTKAQLSCADHACIAHATHRSSITPIDIRNKQQPDAHWGR